MTIVLKDRKSYIQKTDFDEKRFRRFFDEIVMDSDREFDEKELEEIKKKIIEEVLSRNEIYADKLFDLIIRESNEMINAETPNYTYLSAATLRRKLYKLASKERGFNYKDGYGDYLSFVIMMTEKGIYSDEILKAYTEKELRQAGKLIDKSKDKLFSYAGLFLLNNTYLYKGYNGETLELPQERFLTASLYLLKDEKESQRMKLVKEAYWVLSNHYVGLATPTLKSSGAPHGSLSSCHEITWNDDLYNIYDVQQQTARFSQNGAGIGIFGGYLRSQGSWIRGIKGRATGITHPSRSMSVLAEYVNQLGTRVAGIAIYLPVWHLDIFSFLELRLKTGSQERRAHSIKTAVCIPDEFMRRLNNKQTWTIVDPYEVRKKLGIDINRLYDKKKLQDGEEPNPDDHAFTYHYRQIEKADLELKQTINVSEIHKAMFTSRKTGGTPYLYFSDTAARMNPNSHKGMPLGSNLCSEIIMNQSYDELIKEEIDNETGEVVTHIKSGDLVTCNLSSLCLHNVFGQDVDLQRVVDIQTRLLDNVISLNRTVVPQAQITNHKYRPIGMGSLGLATLVAEKGIQWDSFAAYGYVDKLFEKIAKAVIIASHKLGLEKGSYPVFKGSDWHTGEYFEKRNYNSEEWLEIKEITKKAMRNGYLLAIAPTSSNSIIMNGSPSIDPLYEVIYREVKSGLNVIITPSNYNEKTKEFYKSGFEMDEMWSINVVAAAMKHVDQAISHNMHVLKSINGKEMVRLDVGAWNKGLKTIYYTYTEEYKRADNCSMCEA
ncbi:ribonucleoside-diphosphate reductase subunit alpha [Paenibacillus elgii]|uniref:ribonucleoside-diphosphate reductase subunit alpha n=1 Tax=Paenibacillus elgii TaxID=189691 RepID=UPI000248D204|nr:ribonucleoside-diphosphate reductase subunit alpha [Paenibacillus elgii]